MEIAFVMLRRWLHQKYGWFNHQYGPEEITSFTTSNFSTKTVHTFTIRRCPGCPVSACIHVGNGTKVSRPLTPEEQENSVLCRYARAMRQNQLDMERAEGEGMIDRRE